MKKYEILGVEEKSKQNMVGKICLVGGILILLVLIFLQFRNKTIIKGE